MVFNPNPLFYKMAEIVSKNYFGSDKKVCVRIRNEGGSRCFDGKQNIDTSKGQKAISDIKAGDMVLTLNEAENKVEYKRVECLHVFDNDKASVRLKMKDGSIIQCTEDHEFYYNGGWHSLKHLLSLKEKSK